MEGEKAEAVGIMKYEWPQIRALLKKELTVI